MYDFDVADVHGFVLAGGKSTRMGQDKAFLEFESGKAIERAVALAQGVADKVFVVGDRVRFEVFAPTVQDVYLDRGPLGGIHAALSRAAADLNLMIAVDLPRLKVPLLSYIVAEARAGGAIVTVPQVAGRLQPLSAVYRTEFGAIAEQALAEGRNKIDDLFSQVSTRVIDEPELARAGFSAELFANVNTPAEYKSIVQRDASS